VLSWPVAVVCVSDMAWFRADVRWNFVDDSRTKVWQQQQEREWSSESDG